VSNTFEGGFATITQTGVTVTTGAASAQLTIPNDSAGNLPRYIRVAATVESYVKIGASPTATTNDILIQPADSVILSVNGAVKLAYIQGTSAGKVNVTPLENV
jgi:hypothetical protein